MTEPMTAQEKAAMEYMRRYTALIMEAAGGAIDKLGARTALSQIAAETGVSHEQAIDVLQRRVKPLN